MTGKYDNLVITVKADGEEIYSREKGNMSWLETGKITVDSILAEKIAGSKEITICASEKQNGNDIDDNGKDNK